LGYIVQAILVAVVACLGTFYGRLVPVDAQLTVFSDLRNTAGITFGVLGVWIAVMYSPGLSALWSSDHNDREEKEFQRVKPLLVPMSYSVLVFLVSVPLSFLGLVLPNAGIPSSAYEYIRISLATVLGACVGLQTLAIFLALYPAVEIPYRMKRRRIKDAMRERRRPLR
jgi:hypothetical protein